MTGNILTPYFSIRLSTKMVTWCFPAWCLICSKRHISKTCETVNFFCNEIFWDWVVARFCAVKSYCSSQYVWLCRQSLKSLETMYLPCHWFIIQTIRAVKAAAKLILAHLISLFPSSSPHKQFWRISALHSDNKCRQFLLTTKTQYALMFSVLRHLSKGGSLLWSCCIDIV